MTILPLANWHMYSPEGNKVVDEKVDEFIRDMWAGKMQRYQLEGRYHRLLHQVKITGHSEVYDTVVREAICAKIDKVCDELNWHRMDE